MVDTRSDIATDTKINRETANEYSLNSTISISSNMNSHTNSRKTISGVTPMDCDESKCNPVTDNQPNVEEEDPVVHEIPVFLAQSLAKQLFLYQVWIILLLDVEYSAQVHLYYKPQK